MTTSTADEAPLQNLWADPETGRSVAVLRRRLTALVLASPPSVRAEMLRMARNGRSLALEVSVSLRIQHGRTAELDRSAVENDEHWRFAMVEIGAGGGARLELEACLTSELPT